MLEGTLGYTWIIRAQSFEVLDGGPPDTWHILARARYSQCSGNIWKIHLKADVGRAPTVIPVYDQTKARASIVVAKVCPPYFYSAEGKKKKKEESRKRKLKYSPRFAWGGRPHRKFILDRHTHTHTHIYVYIYI